MKYIYFTYITRHRAVIQTPEADSHAIANCVIGPLIVNAYNNYYVTLPQVYFTGRINFPNLYTKIVKLKHTLNYNSCKKNSEVAPRCRLRPLLADCLARTSSRKFRNFMI